MESGGSGLIGAIKSLRPRKRFRRAAVAAFFILVTAGLAAEMIGAVALLLE